MKTSPIRSASGRKSAWTRKQQAAPPSNSNFSAPVPQPGGASVDLLDDDLTDGEADFEADGSTPVKKERGAPLSPSLRVEAAQQPPTPHSPASLQLSSSARASPQGSPVSPMLSSRTNASHAPMPWSECYVPGGMDDSPGDTPNRALSSAEKLPKQYAALRDFPDDFDVAIDGVELGEEQDFDDFGEDGSSLEDYAGGGDNSTVDADTLENESLTNAGGDGSTVDADTLDNESLIDDLAAPEVGDLETELLDLERELEPEEDSNVPTPKASHFRKRGFAQNFENARVDITMDLSTGCRSECAALLNQISEMRSTITNDLTLLRGEISKRSEARTPVLISYSRRTK